MVDSGRGISAGRSYIASIEEIYYIYTVQGGDDIYIGNGIAAAVGVVSSTYVDASNTLILQGNIPGKSFSTVILPPRNNLGNLIGGVDFSAPTSTGDPAYIKFNSSTCIKKNFT